MALHHPDEVGVGWRLELVFGNLLDTVDEAPTSGAIEEGLGIGRTELEVGNDVSLTDPDGESPKSRRGAYRLAMNCEMTGNGSRTLRHRTHHILQKY